MLGSETRTVETYGVILPLPSWSFTLMNHSSHSKSYEGELCLLQKGQGSAIPLGGQEFHSAPVILKLGLWQRGRTLLSQGTGLSRCEATSMWPVLRHQGRRGRLAPRGRGWETSVRRSGASQAVASPGFRCGRPGWVDTFSEMILATGRRKNWGWSGAEVKIPMRRL